MTPEQARERFAAAAVARLATASATGVPHLVPVTFAVRGDVIASAVDDKPKSTTRLRRLRNIERNPAVSLLVDHYDHDWSRLWWVRADGAAHILAPGNGPDRRDVLLRELRAKYPQYENRPPSGPLVVIEVTRWSGWTAWACAVTR
ncbi:TIGR03668 family PPOX class F420-dependent oxidoreductase [Haloechinothrix sp. LS1_15]|nr:TIGR03668 family PPOX class F420-dependent oxidoreductase [Haloechinothrix sp. LS1_15]MDV6014037.1 TIGR03668 family PPOX class F420-dependent oxidoreductase [Haloechinothrix sp. LS1_15]